MGTRRDRIPGSGFDLEPEHGCKANGAQHPKPIFSEALPGIADRTNQARLQVRTSPDEVDNFIRFRIEEHPVDCEVAAGRIFRRRRKMDLCWMPAIKVSAVRTKGSDLELQSILEHDDHTKVRTDRVGS